MVHIRLDLHIHTTHSGDSLLTYDRLLPVLRKKNLHGVAVTDHNTISGALEWMERNPPFKIIVGEEIQSRDGEVIGLFLSEEIEPGMTMEKTVKAIKLQNGVVYLPHPFDRWRKSRLNLLALEAVWDEVDIIEVNNARNLFSSWNRKAGKLASVKEKVRGAGSDAHSPWEIGRSYVEMENYTTREEFLVNLARGTVIEGNTSWAMRLFVKLMKIKEGL